MENTQITFRPSEEKRRILLVEDELINQQILQQMLSGAYEVLPAVTGAQAVELLQANQETLSLVLLDLNLPDMHGTELLKSLRSDGRYSRLPVIVMTADSDAEVACLELGAIDFIPKPYPRPEVVLARVRRTIEFSEDRDLLHWTERDSLTGLYNKEFFYRYAIQLDAYHRDAPTDSVLININHFHLLNERYGKDYGDEVLRSIGAGLLSIVEKTGGIACRSEADHFLLYTPHRENYQELLDGISAALKAPAGGENHTVRLRMGVYSRVDKALDIERRFDRAKMASDKMRNNFAASVGFYDHSMHENEVLMEQLLEELPVALREEQFDVYYQPKFDVRGEHPVLSSAEALIRWRHPRMGLISPGVFIPLFENTGLVRDVDYYVWLHAARQIRDWQDRLGIRLPVSVNVSRIDLFDPHLTDKLQGIIVSTGLSYQDLLLEVTESAYTDNPEQIIETVNQLRKMGFLIEMDDFGSGYSSLNMLSSLPIDALKLDMQFVRNAFRNQKGTRLLKSIIHLADFFDVTTIAEGVETAEQVSTLKAMGCDIIQGYYFSRPLPTAEFEAYMLENRPLGEPV